MVTLTHTHFSDHFDHICITLIRRINLLTGFPMTLLSVLLVCVHVMYCVSPNDFKYLHQLYVHDFAGLHIHHCVAPMLRRISYNVNAFTINILTVGQHITCNCWYNAHTFKRKVNWVPGESARISPPRMTFFALLSIWSFFDCHSVQLWITAGSRNVLACLLKASWVCVLSRIASNIYKRIKRTLFVKVRPTHYAGDNDHGTFFIFGKEAPQK